MGEGVKKRLEEMARWNAESRQLSGCREGTPVDRTRSAVSNGLRKRMKEVMMEIEKSLLELHQVFLDMAVMVEA